MIIIGITGGVGSGKSTALNYLKNEYNAYIVEADKLAHRLMQPGEIIYRNIIEAFGDCVIDFENSEIIDRKKLGDIVFNDKESLNKLNKIVHPLVKQYILEDISNKKESGERMYVIEAALLIEDGYKEICDEIWYIHAGRECRMKRLMSSRGYTKEKCLSMFESQSSDEYYKKYANLTINNEESFENSSKQLKVRLNKLLDNDILI